MGLRVYGCLGRYTIINSFILYNSQIGILLGTGTQAKIVRNTLLENGQGIVCISCAPLVDENLI